MNNFDEPDYDDDEFPEFDDDKEFIDACAHANQIEEASVINENGDEDDWDEEDLHGSRTIDDPQSTDEDEDEDEDEDGETDGGFV